jgi:hypothetical protein
MKKIIIVSSLLFILSGCVKNNQEPTEELTETHLVKNIDNSINEMEKSPIEDELKKEAIMYDFAKQVIQYGGVSTDEEKLRAYLVKLSELRNDHSFLLTDDEWQNLQEQWQELNDPTD